MYTLYQFSATALPIGRPEFDGSTPQSVESFISLAGGSRGFDTLGTESAPLQVPYTLSYQCVATGTSAAGLRTTLDTLRGLVGIRALLYRKGVSDSAYQTVYARLRKIEMKTEPAHQFGLWQPLILTFDVQSEYWSASSITTVTKTITASPASQLLINAGTAPVRDCLVTLTTPNLSNVIIGVTGRCQFQYNAAVAASDFITIDCGARTVKDNHLADQYSHFSLTSNHVIAEWLRLDPGVNTITITCTGSPSGDTVKFDYYSKYI